MSKEDVDNYPSVAGHKLISCQVEVKWAGGESDSFCYEVKFHGARENSYGLTVTLPTLCRREL